jgi:hypothetical protein
MVTTARSFRTVPGVVSLQADGAGLSGADLWWEW